MKGYRKYSIHMKKDTIHKCAVLFLLKQWLKKALCIEYIMWSAQSQEKDILRIKNCNNVYDIKMVISIKIWILDRLCQFCFPSTVLHTQEAFRKLLKRKYTKKTTTFVNKHYHKKNKTNWRRFRWAYNLVFKYFLFFLDMS